MRRFLPAPLQPLYRRIYHLFDWGNDPYWFIPSPDPVRWGMSAWFAVLLTGYMVGYVDRPPSMLHAGASGTIASFGMDLGCIGIMVAGAFRLPWRSNSLKRRTGAMGWESVAAWFVSGGAVFSAFAVYSTSPDNGKYAALSSLFVALMYLARGIQIVVFLYQVQLAASLIQELQKGGDPPSPHS